MTTQTKPQVKRFNHRHKQVAINQASGMNQTDAYLAVYHCDYETAKQQASILNVTNPLFKDYLNTLIERKESLALEKITETMLSKQEKRQLLATFARAQLADLLDDNGNIKLDKNSPAMKALKEYSSRVKLDKEGNPIVNKHIKMLDPLAAIQEDNKMSGDYAPTKHQVAKAVQINVSVVDKTSKGKQEAVTLGSGDDDVLELEGGE
uniref:Putative terminase n=1 Tax=viral metagenome TaxID=1070528 RepID=A0A6M3JNI1_9ZZZZ